MKSYLHYISFVIAFFFTMSISAYAQSGLNNYSKQDERSEKMRQNILNAVGSLVDQVNELIETISGSLDHSKILHYGGRMYTQNYFEDISEDSTKKISAIRNAQIELQRELDSLKLQAKELEKRMQTSKSEDQSDIEKDMRRLQSSIEKLQHKLEKIQKKSEKYRRNIEDKYIGESKTLTRYNDDLTIEKDDVIDSDVIVTNGDAKVYGKINGKLVVTNGDILLGDSAIIAGDVVCVNGDVTKKEGARVHGNIVENSMLSVSSGHENDDDEDIGNNFYQRYPSSISSGFPLRSSLEESFIRYNRVEGLYIGAAQAKKLYWISQPFIVSSGSLGYGFASHTWRYSLGLYKPIYFENQILEIGGEGHSLTDSKDQWLVGREENSVMAFFAREDFMDYFTRRGFSTSIGYHVRFDQGMQTRFIAAYQHDTYRSMDKATDWSVFGGGKVFRENPLVNESNINSIFLTAGLSTVTKVWKQLEGWDVQASHEIAGGATKGDYNFTQTTIDVRRYQPIGDYLNFNIRARAGASSGTLPLQRTFEFGGISTLPGYRFKEFGGTHILLGNAELIVNGSFADGTHGFVSSILRNINLIAFSDFGITNITDARDIIITRDFTSGSIDASFADGFTSLQKNNVKSDVGFAIGSADGDFRIGLAWRLDKPSSANFILRFTRPF